MNGDNSPGCHHHPPSTVRTEAAHTRCKNVRTRCKNPQCLLSLQTPLRGTLPPPPQKASPRRNTMPPETTTRVHCHLNNEPMKPRALHEPSEKPFPVQKQGWNTSNSTKSSRPPDLHQVLRKKNLPHIYLHQEERCNRRAHDQTTAATLPMGKLSVNVHIVLRIPRTKRKKREKETMQMKLVHPKVKKKKKP